MNKKERNTGIIYEILVRRLVEESTNNAIPQRAFKLLKKYFKTDSLLRDELVLYNNLTERDSDFSLQEHAEELLYRVLSARSTMPDNLLESTKYELIGDIKKMYGLREFFQTPLPQDFYRLQGSIYHLFEGTASPKDDIRAKKQIVEHLTSDDEDTKQANKLVEEFLSEDLSVREFALKRMHIIYENKIKHLSESQKSILKTYLYGSASTTGLQETIQTELKTLIPELKSIMFGDSDTDKALQIKLNEVVSILEGIQKKTYITDDNIEQVLLAIEFLKNRRNA